MNLIKTTRTLILLIIATFTLQSCIDEETVLPITANFSTNLVVEQNQATITLNNTSQNATSYEWTFPNGTPASSSEENPTVTYTENGTYVITLVASNGAETATKTVEITVNGIQGNSNNSGCTLTTACETVNLTGSPRYSVTSENNGNGGYTITVTDSTGTVVYQKDCDTNGSISINCGG